MFDWTGQNGGIWYWLLTTTTTKQQKFYQKGSKHPEKERQCIILNKRSGYPVFPENVHACGRQHLRTNIVYASEFHLWITMPAKSALSYTKYTFLPQN